MFDKEIIEQIYRIKNKFKILKQIDPDFKMNYQQAREHQYRMNMYLSIDNLEMIEKKLNVILPIEYKAFLFWFGNSLAGPGFGLSPLGSFLDKDDKDEVEEVTYRLKNAHKPFRYKTDWTPYDDRFHPKYLNFEDYANSQYGSLEKYQEKYGKLEKYSKYDFFDPEMLSLDGTIYLCHQGCGRYNYLVANGESYGQIWESSFATGSNFYKLEDNFLDWYESWLNNS